MAKIEVYTKDYCPYCTRAKQLLDAKGASYTEFDVTNDMDKFEEMKQKADGRKTVPQVFVDGVGLGGFDDINRLDQEGKLDSIINA
ncbi:MAG: glutaredoxin 3 [Rickettsiales bacterium]|nr:glutaredoxin 3 [Rickettsiales bacterium]